MEPEQVIVRFARKRMRRTMGLGILLLFLLTGMPLFGERLSQAGIALVAIALFIAFGLFTWLDWRCPSCGRNLGRDFKYAHCPHCQVKLMP
ncbi:MAG: hypothetical protein ACOY93_20825 [Bacillota bacterium]